MKVLTNPGNRTLSEIFSVFVVLTIPAKSVPGKQEIVMPMHLKHSGIMCFLLPTMPQATNHTVEVT